MATHEFTAVAENAAFDTPVELDMQQAADLGTSGTVELLQQLVDRIADLNARLAVLENEG